MDTSDGLRQRRVATAPLPQPQDGSSDPPRHHSYDKVRKDETRLTKIFQRVVIGALLLCVFCGLIYLGHAAVCAFVVVVEVILFKELVRVRYSTYFETIQDTIPLFRTTQWMWFAVASSYTYGDFLTDMIQSNLRLHYLLPYAQYFNSVSFLLYSGTFVLTIYTLQREHIRFQINQLCWTILVLCLTIGQLKYIMHNIFNGLVWFVLPCCLVFTNDIMAYVCGLNFGRKFIQRPFIRFSPNKTWEGFIGGWIFTMIISWYLAGFLAQFPWMTCPTNDFWAPHDLECELDPTFSPAISYVPSQIFELLPRNVVKMLFPRIVELCTRPSSTDSALAVVAEPCVSGDVTQVYSHFELVVRDYVPLQGHALWLAMFASLVAPFGGFLASAIKRAYGLKDFDSLIPGHGGLMDRMDCQFLMALCVWVYYNTFIKLASISVSRLTYMYSLLSDAEKHEFLETIGVMSSGRNPAPWKKAFAG